MSKQMACTLLFAVVGVLSAGNATAGLIQVSDSGDTIVGLYNTVAGGNGSVLGVNDSEISKVGFYNQGQGPENLLDGIPATKFCTPGSDDYSGNNTGFYITLSAASKVTAIQFATANDEPARDPKTITIEGSNATGSDLLLGSSWTSLYSDVSGLADTWDRLVWGNTVTFSNAGEYTSYRVLVSETRNIGPLMQISEVALYSAIPEPGTLTLVITGLVGLLAYAWRKRK